MFFIDCIYKIWYCIFSNTLIYIFPSLLGVYCGIVRLTGGEKVVINFNKRKKGAVLMAALDKTRKDEIEKRVNEIIDQNNLNVPGFDLAKFLT